MSLQVVAEQAADLFRRNGYHKTSMQDIADACLIKKSSLYHHIDGREALLGHVASNALDYFHERAHAVLENKTLDDAARRAKFIMLLEDYFLNGNGGALLIKLIHEIAYSIPVFTEVLTRYFNKWHEVMQSLYRVDPQDDKLIHAIDDYLAQLHGAVLMWLVNDDREIVLRAAARLEKI